MCIVISFLDRQGFDNVPRNLWPFLPSKLWPYGSVAICTFVLFISLGEFSSVLWLCWLGIRKSIQPVKNWVMRCWHGYLSGARCKCFAYNPADATATPSSLALLKSRLVELLWCQLTQAVLEQEAVKRVSVLFVLVNVVSWMRRGRAGI